jgi:DNA (cytosine-5)-methyltransferase 1
MALRTISICAGVGGLDLGVRIARPNTRCVAFVEREASAAASLVASMEAGRLHPAPIWSDLRTFDPEPWRGAVDCVLSGDPCQGNSVAGKRLGEDDDRWLLDRAIDVFDGSGAHTFFRENVVGQLAVAVPALERLGCRVAAGIFSAAEAGASHRRERFFILAYRDRDEPGADSQRTDAGSDRWYDAGGGVRTLDDALRGRHGHADETLRTGRDGSVDAGG